MVHICGPEQRVHFSGKGPNLHAVPDDFLVAIEFVRVVTSTIVCGLVVLARLPISLGLKSLFNRIVETLLPVANWLSMISSYENRRQKFNKTTSQAHDLIYRSEPPGDKEHV